MTAQPAHPSMLPEQPPALWRIADLARHLACSKRWISYRLSRVETEPGSIPHVRLGRTPRFDPEEIRAWVRAGCPSTAVFRQSQVASSKSHPKGVRP